MERGQASASPRAVNDRNSAMHLTRELAMQNITPAFKKGKALMMGGKINATGMTGFVNEERTGSQCG